MTEKLNAWGQDAKTSKAEIARLKKNKQGMFSDADKKAVKENTPPKSKRTTSDGYMPRTDKGKGLVGNSGLKGHGVNSPAMMKARSEIKAKQRIAQ